MAEVSARRCSLQLLDAFRVKQDKKMISRLASSLSGERWLSKLWLMVGAYAHVHVFMWKLPDSGLDVPTHLSKTATCSDHQ
jgi:hypothetical protein